MTEPLISKELRDRLHGPGCECPWHRPEIYLQQASDSQTEEEATEKP